MSTDGTDDDALTWAGDDEPAVTSTPGQRVPAEPTKPRVASGWKVVGKTGATAEAAEVPDAPAPRQQMGSVILVVHGILGGIYLLFIVGWLIAAQRDSAAPADVVGNAMYNVGLSLAVLAPALWFGTVLWLTRGAVSSRNRLIALAVGVLVLLPVPFLVGGLS